MSQIPTSIPDLGGRQSETGQEPDAHGQAALLLSESILHALVETGTLTPGTAAAVVRAACEVKVEIAEMSNESDSRMRHSLDLLTRIEHSIRSDIDFES